MGSRRSWADRAARAVAIGAVVVLGLTGTGTAAGQEAPAEQTAGGEQVAAPDAAGGESPAAPSECTVPQAGHGPQAAAPGDVGVDQAKLDEAIAFAASRMRVNIQVYRNNCLIGRGPLNQYTDDMPWHLWSSTKSIVSLLAGIATTQGKLDLGAPIGTYLDEGQGDEAHRSITVRNLLTQTSGLKQSIVSEGVPSALDLDANIAEQALALPVEHEPGTFFEYTQRGPDLLAHVIEKAVGEDLQSFAQRELFDPIGIGADRYHWSRDRSGHTYGFAFMYMPPSDFGRIGMLLANNGDWNGRRLISEDYMRQMRTPSEANGCYGYLVWVNGKPCTGPTFPSRQTVDVAPFQGFPDDAFATVGFLQQNNFLIPSLGLQVTWNGAFGDQSPDPSTVLSANVNSELYRTFLRMVVGAYTDQQVPDPGAYSPTFNLDFDPMQTLNPDVFLSSFGAGPDAPKDCDFFRCGDTPLRAPFQDNPGCFVLACAPRGTGN